MFHNTQVLTFCKLAREHRLEDTGALTQERRRDAEPLLVCANDEDDIALRSDNNSFHGGGNDVETKAWSVDACGLVDERRVQMMYSM